MIPKRLTKVKCPSCRAVNPEAGKDQTCENCGYYPMPSYDYPKGHWLNPITCNCEYNKNYHKPKLKGIRQRKTPKPTINDLKEK